MMGAALPAALLSTALAFALCFAPRRAFLPALALFAAAAVIVAMLPIPERFAARALAGCWISTGATAATVHLSGRWAVERTLALGLAVNAGVWVGVVIAVAGTPADLARALPAALLVLPARWLTAHRAGIAVKVAASWLVAIAILAGALPIVPTPGYAQDHFE